MRRETEVWWVDAFTAEPFAGNPAAVAFLESWPSDTWLQAVAREMNLSETAFLVGREDGEFELRWFTPAAEVDLCGHATLASTKALAASNRVGSGARVRFHTRSGVLGSHVVEDGIELDFPATPPRAEAAAEGLLEALGLPATDCRWTGRSRYDHFLELGDERAVRGVRPDFRRLATVDTRGVIVTAAGGPDGRPDFVSRFFAPAVGVDEDPVTGSAHCALAPYWSDRLGRAELLATQLSERGGELRVRVEGDRVRLRGAAVVVARGTLLVPPA